MREPRRDSERLQHMLDAINLIQEFTDNILRDELFNDKMRYYAVVKNLEIIGEAANMLTYDFRSSHPELPWVAIIGMRNVIVHDYIHIHEDMLWDTIQNDLQPLKQQLEVYLSKLTLDKR